MAAKPYRLLALVKQDAVVRVQKEPDDTVMTWPHLLSIEFFAAAMMSIFLHPHGRLRERPARGARQPERHAGGGQGALVPRRRSRSCWPTSTRRWPACWRPPSSSSGAALIPYIDRGPRGDGGSPRPSDRKVGVMLFTIFWGAGLAITFLGAFFRGPGYAWTMPVRRRASSSHCRDDDGQLEADPRAGAAGARRTPVLREMRHGRPGGLSRRQLIRRSHRRGHGPLAPRGHARARSASCGPTWRAASAARSTSATSTRSTPTPRSRA